MNAPSGNQKPSFWDFLLSLFSGLKPSGGIVRAGAASGSARQHHRAGPHRNYRGFCW